MTTFGIGMKYPNVIEAKSFLIGEHPEVLVDGKWYPARPLGYPSFRRRIRAAWLVFSGRADALVWKEQG